MEQFTNIITFIALWLKLVLETMSILLIAFGALSASYQAVRNLRTQNDAAYQLRFIFSRYLVIALEFMLAADILATAVAPSWNEIGKLGAIAVIRTFLNVFLQWEMRSKE